MMIQKEIHAAYMEFVMDALQTQTVKVLVANEDEVGEEQTVSMLEVFRD